VVSWAAVDGSGRRKPLWYALRSAYADRLLTVQPDGEELRVHVANDSPDPLRGTLSIERLRYDGSRQAGLDVEVTVPARGTASIPVPAEVARPDDASAELLRATIGDHSAAWFFADYRASALPPADLEVGAEPAQGGVAVTVRAASIVRDLSLLADRVDPAAEVDRMLVTLLPGESVTFLVRTGTAAGPDRFTTADVLRTANDLVAGTGRRRFVVRGNDS
jgi:beta-mannosidase